MSSKHAETSAAETRETAPAARTDSFGLTVWRQFKRNSVALAGFYAVLFLAFVALFADFLANDKPYYLEYQGRSYFPIFRSYLVGAGLAQWPPELLNVDFKKLKGAKAIFPPVPYRPSNIDLFAPYEAPSLKHWFGTDRLGRDIMAGMIHGSRISLSIGFVAVGIPLGVTLSFLIASPLVNEVAVVLLYGMFGFEVAALYIGAGLVLAIVAGFVLGRMRLERHIEPMILEAAAVAPLATGGAEVQPDRGSPGSAVE